VFQEGMVEVEVEVNGERAVTTQSLSALTITRWVTSRRIVWRTMVTPHKLSPRVMRMCVLWWCLVVEMKKVIFLTLGVMLCRALVVWRDVKHLTSDSRGGGKITEEAKVRILVINL